MVLEITDLTTLALLLADLAGEGDLLAAGETDCLEGELLPDPELLLPELLLLDDEPPELLLEPELELLLDPRLSSARFCSSWAKRSLSVWYSSAVGGT